MINNNNNDDFMINKLFTYQINIHNIKYKIYICILTIFKKKK